MFRAVENQRRWRAKTCEMTCAVHTDGQQRHQSRREQWQSFAVTVDDPVPTLWTRHVYVSPENSQRQSNCGQQTQGRHLPVICLSSDLTPACHPTTPLPVIRPHRQNVILSPCYPAGLHSPAAAGDRCPNPKPLNPKPQLTQLQHAITHPNEVQFT